MKAIVYMMRATGIIRIQRSDTPAGGDPLSGLSSRVLFWVIRVDGDACVYNSLLSLNLVDANLGVLLLMMWDSKVVAIEFGNKNSRLGAKTPRDLRQQAVMVGILLFENVHGTVAGEIQALVLRIIAHVVDHAHCIQAGNHFARVRVHHDQLTWIARYNKQPVIGFVERHGHVGLIALR